MRLEKEKEKDVSNEKVNYTCRDVNFFSFG